MNSLILRRFSTVTFAALILLGVATPSRATTVITWDVSTITADADVITTGTLVSAVRIGTDGYPGPTGNVTVNGVAFVPGSFASTPVSGTISQGAFDLSYYGSNSLYGNAVTLYGSPLGDLLSQGVNQQGGTVGQLTVNGLTTGNDYKLQVFSFLGDYDNPAGVNGSFIKFDPSTAGYTGSGSTSVNGQFLIASFTASSPSLTLDWSVNNAGGLKQAAINAIQLRDVSIVPEPTQMVSVAAIGSALGMWRMRKLRRNGRGSNATAC